MRTKNAFIRRSATATSALALATALTAGPVAAQSFNAPAPEVISGTVSFSTAGTTDTFDVSSATAVLDFTPNDTGIGGGPINFQNAGTTAIFQSTPSNPNFVVLSRIVPNDPTRAIQFNGTVRSQIAGASVTPGGSLWFYSPGGIILGSNASFDVGSLLLATGDPTGGTGTIGSTNSFTIASVADSGATVRIDAGAQIKATPEGSYVALVAPVVRQDGVVRVNGSAAYVAAETASLTINQGLFDIGVQVGSDGGGTPLIHGGTTGGPSSTGSTGDNHGIFMVAVPKNSAITMLIAPTGDLGFDVASQAGIKNGAIYLQAGGNLKVTPTNPVETRVESLPTAPLEAVISLAGGNATGIKVTSDLVAQATGNTTVQSTAANKLLSFEGDAYLYSAKTASLTNSSGGQFTANGRVIVNAFGPAAGQANILAQSNSSMKFLGDVDVYATSYPQRAFPSGFNLAQGGNAFFQADGAAASITAGKVRVYSNGIAPSGGGSATAGKSQMLAINGGALNLSGNVELFSFAIGVGIGATGTGGQAALVVDKGQIAIGGNLLTQVQGGGQNGSDAVGGFAQVFAGAQGGDIDVVGSITLTAMGLVATSATGPVGKGTGGIAAFDLSATSGGAVTTLDVGAVSMFARGIGGAAGTNGSFAGGNALGGTARLNVGKGVTMTSLNGVSADARAQGGLGGPGGAGGNATGGSVQLNVNGGAFSTKGISLVADVTGGAGGAGPNLTTPGGKGGAAAAGSGVSMFVTNGGSVKGQATTLDATATGGTGGSGFSGTGPAGSGGAAAAANTFVGTDTSGQITLAALTLQSNAVAGSGGTGTAQPGGAGGAATSGDASVNANAGTIQLSALTVRSSAFGGTGVALGANGGAATSKTAAANAINNGLLKVTGGNVDLTARASGGDASGAVGGATVQAGEASGGVASIFAGSGGTVNSTASLASLDASGDGGAEQGNGNVTGAIGRGGNARVNANAGTVLLGGEVELLADGRGGDGGGTGNAGAGIGGEARLGTFGAVGSSKVEVTGDLVLDASGTGGGAEAGLGGDGLGGTPPDIDVGPFNKGAYLVAIGGNVTIGGDGIELSANGIGGDGSGGGGAGVGGLTNLVTFGAAISAPGVVNMDSSGLGGDGDFATAAKGGAGKGGFALLSATSGGDSQGGGVIPLGTPSSVTLGQTFLDASGTGGEGGSGADGQAGGVGGEGTGGRANALAQSGSGQLTTEDLFIFLQGVGGFGGDGGQPIQTGGAGGAGGQGGVGTGGFTNFGTASGPDTTANAGSATFGTASVFVNGIGGDGGAGAGSSSGGAGGLGVGGNGAMLSRGTPVTLDVLSINASAFGGQGGTSGSTGAVQGAGGAAQGGAASLLVTNRFNRPERGSLTADQVILFGGAIGGAGVTTGATTAGQAFAQVTKSDATVNIASITTFGDAPAPAGAESGLVVDAGTLAVAASLDLSSVGDVKLSVINGGLITTPDLSIVTTGSLLPPGAGTPGLIDIGASFLGDFGGDFISSSDFDVGDSFNLTAEGQIKVGNVSAGANVDVTAAGSLAIGNVLAGDSIFLSSGQTITTGDLSAALNPDLDGSGDIEIASFGSATIGNVQGATIDFQFGDPTAPPVVVKTGSIAAETISLDIGGSITTGTIRTAEIYPGIDTSFDEYLIGIGASGDIKLGTVDAFTSVGIGSVRGKVETGAITAKDSVLLLAATSVSTGGVTTGADANDSLFISNASIILTNPDFAVLQDFDELGGEFDIDVLATAAPVRTGGLVTLTGPVSTANFAAAAAGGFQVNAITAPRRLLLDSGAALSVGNLTTNGTLTLKTGQTITVGGLLSAPTILLESDDLVFDEGGAIGTASTDSIQLRSTGGLTFGGGSTDGYSINGSEAQGLRARTISIAGSSIVIRQATLSGSGAGTGANLVGSSGELVLTSTGGIRVEGPLAVNNATAGNRVRLFSAVGPLEVVTDQGGGVALMGATSTQLEGTLQIEGEAVRVATNALLGQLPTLSADQRFAALRTAPNGSPRPEGYLQAGRIEFTANQLFIQNSNTATQFGGFSAGSRGANLRSRSGTGTADAIIFGRIADSSGTFKLNQDAVSLLTLNSGEGTDRTPLTPTSSFNACAFTGACGTPVEPPPPSPVEEEEVEVVIDRIANVVASTIADALSSTADPEEVGSLPTVNLVTTIDTGPIRTEPVISDPVTGGGNPGLWEGQQDQDQRDGDSPAPGGDGQ